MITLSESTVGWMFLSVVILAGVHAFTVHSMFKVYMTGKSVMDDYKQPRTFGKV